MVLREAIYLQLKTIASVRRFTACLNQMSYISFPILGVEGLAEHSASNAACMVMCLKMEREDREKAAHGMIIYRVKRGKGQDEVTNKAAIISKLTAAALLTPSRQYHE